MNKTLKIFFTLLLTISFFPTVVSAAWWNPFSWNWNFFKKEQVEQISPLPITEVVQNEKPETAPIEKIEKENITQKPTAQTPTIKKEVVVPKKVESKPIQKEITPIEKKEEVLSEEKVEEIIETKIEEIKKIELVISNINISEITPYSAKVSWRTNMPSESKILINGETLFSTNGVSTQHEVTVNSLKENSLTSGNITAISNGAWISSNVVIKTIEKPPIVERDCPTYPGLYYRYGGGKSVNGICPGDA